MSGHIHSIQCADLLNSISDYVDGELSPELCAALEEHMAGCENCQVVVNTVRKTIELYHVSNDDPVLPGEVERRLYSRLNLDDYRK